MPIAILKYIRQVLIYLPIVTLVACNGGSTSISGGAATNSGVIYGNSAGMVFANNTLLAGTSQLTTIDNNTINVVVIDSSGNMYAATSFGKVYQYINASGSWIDLSGSGNGGSLDSSSITGISPSSVNILVLHNNQLYAGTASGNLFVYTNSQWNRIGISLHTPIQSLIFDQNDNIYAGCQNGIVYEYTNSQWVSLAAGNPVDGNPVTALVMESNGNLYASTGNNTDNPNGEVYKYNFSNANWVAVSSFTAGSINALAINNNVLYAGAYDGTVFEFQSGSWSALAAPDGTAIQFLTASNGTLYSATNGNGANGQVYAYNQSTTAWDQISFLNNGIITSLTIHNNRFYAGTFNNVTLPGQQSTLYTYESGISWSMVGAANTLDGTPIYSTTVAANGVYYAGTQYNVFKYSNATLSWTQLGNLNLQNNSGVYALATYNGITYAGTASGNVFYNTGTNSNWTQAGQQLPSSNITSLAVNSNGVLYASTNFATNNTNYGNVWQYNSTSGQWFVLSGNGESNSLDSSIVQSITFDSNNNLYAATSGTGSGGLVWEYPSNESSWQLVGSGTPDGSQIEIVKTDSGNNVYVGTLYGNIFKLANNGWQQLGSAPPDGSAISAIAFNPSGVLYAITNGGNVWYYMSSSNIWYNTFYGPGIEINVSAGNGF